jgi:hypothetical protein
MVIDLRKWQKIEGLSFYYIGRWPEDGEYVNKYRMINLTKAEYEDIDSFSSDKNTIVIKFKNGKEAIRSILYAELFRSEVINV